MLFSASGAARAPWLGESSAAQIHGHGAIRKGNLICDVFVVQLRFMAHGPTLLWPKACRDPANRLLARPKGGACRVQGSLGLHGPGPISLRHVVKASLAGYLLHTVPDCCCRDTQQSHPPALTHGSHNGPVCFLRDMVTAATSCGSSLFVLRSWGQAVLSAVRSRSKLTVVSAIPCKVYGLHSVCFLQLALSRLAAYVHMTAPC